MTDHQDIYGIIDVYAAILDGFTFSPTAHINYESAMLRVPDGLPKYPDFSSDFWRQWRDDGRITRSVSGFNAGES